MKFSNPILFTVKYERKFLLENVQIIRPSPPRAAAIIGACRNSCLLIMHKISRRRRLPLLLTTRHYRQVAHTCQDLEGLSFVVIRTCTRVVNTVWHFPIRHALPILARHENTWWAWPILIVELALGHGSRTRDDLAYRFYFHSFAEYIRRIFLEE